MAKHNHYKSWKSLFGKCFGSNIHYEKSKKTNTDEQWSKHDSLEWVSYSDISSLSISPEDLSTTLAGSNLYVFSFAELKTVTRGFSISNFLGSGGFGPVYKGYIDEKLRPGLKAQYVAVKSLDLEGTQGHEEWLAEIIFLGQLRHPNLVKLIGYCCENKNRMIVYEYMDGGSLETVLFKDVETLPWATRLKIAIGAAKGLAFLHEAEKQVIYRDFKASNILLDSDNKAKLSDFGLAKDGPQGDKSHVSTRVMGTHGYAAPEYILTGHLTAKSDVYSFGVVLLEIISGRRCVEKSRTDRETHLVDWAKPYLNKPNKVHRIMDPRLEGLYSSKGAEKAAALAYKCLSHSPKQRPTMRNVVETLEPLMDLGDMPIGPFVFIVPQEKDDKIDDQKTQENHQSYEHRYKQHYPNSTVHSELTLHRDGHDLYKSAMMHRQNPQKKDQER